MGTIAEKLTYLNTTKINLRDSLNKFGSSILSTDTFRSYDTKLNDIYNKLPKITQSGAGFTLENVQNGLLDDFKMIGVDLEQNTTTGKNILPQNEYISSTTINGITYTNNGDGTFSLSGTATAETSIRIIPTEKFNLSNGQQYYLYSSIPYNSSTFNMSIVTLENGTQNYLIVNNNYTPATTPTNSRLQFYIVQGNTVNAQNIKLMLVKGNNDTNYEPYTGGIPSPNPDYPQEIKVVEGRQVITDKGKNLLNISKNVNGYWYKNGVLTANADWSYINDFIEVKASTQYTISRDSSELNESQFSIEEFDENKNYIKQNVLWQNNTNKYSITTDSNTKYVICNYRNGYAHTDLQFESGDNRTDYEPYYEPVSYNIDLQLANIYLAKMPNTTYKNRIYRNNGNWYFEENVEKYIIDGSESWTTQSAYSGYYRYMFVLMENYKNDNLSYGVVGMNSHFIQRITQPHGDYEYLYLQAANNNLLSVYIQIKNLSTIANFKTWLSENNVVVWYVLANPVTTQITNTTLINQLESLYLHTGTNIITISNSNNIIPEIEMARLKELEKLA